MIGRYKKSILSLLHQLRQFQNDPKNTELLRAIQLKLYKQLCAIESRAAHSDEKLAEARTTLRSARLPKEDARKLKAQISTLITRKQGYQDLSYLLRSIGDGLAFTIFDRYDLKPLAFKESPGSLRGKAGRRLELYLLNTALTHGQRAILCDLTNAIKYGDVCLVKFDLPFPIEVKTSRNENARTSRQIEKLGKMIKYLHTDEIEGLYDRPGITRRVSLIEKQVGHAHALSPLIDEAYRTGFAIREVEPGLSYAVFRKFDASKMEEFYGGSRQIQFDTLNHHKYTGMWAPFTPFVLSIADPQQCLGFASGDFVIAIAIDIAEAKRIARELGYTLWLERPEGIQTSIDAETAKSAMWWFTPSQSDPKAPEYMAIGGHMIQRVFFEFASLKWLVKHGCTPPTTELVERMEQIQSNAAPT
jgi:hypothetical protein